MDDAALAALVAAEADRPAPADAALLARALADRPGVAAILFYGSRRRGAAGAGPIDLYVLTDRPADWSGPGLAALAGRLLPPNVYALRLAPPDATAVEAKVAVMTLSAFAARMDPEGWDGTLWARFAQPASLLYARDAAAREAALAALAAAVRAASVWAARLATPAAPWGTPECWIALFRRTYAAELRPERPGRAAELVAAAPDWFAALSRLDPPAAPDPHAARRWRARAAAGKALNLARLLKAAFTYSGGLRYLAGKVSRARR